MRPLTNPLILSSYQKSATGRALTTNTAVATMVGAGIKDNVVPSSSRVVCNTRILPGYSINDIVDAYAKRAAEFGGTVQWYNDYGSGPTSSSSYESADFITLGQSIKSTFPNTLISPLLLLTKKDWRHGFQNFDGLITFALNYFVKYHYSTDHFAWPHVQVLMNESIMPT